MPQPISTKTHGLLDYGTAVLLFVLPSLLRWDRDLSQRVRLAAVGTALYSLMTRYEWGWEPVKVLPMRGHLVLDGASGALFCAGPLLVPRQPIAVKAVLVGLGLFELGVTALTQPTPEEE